MMRRVYHCSKHDRYLVFDVSVLLQQHVFMREQIPQWSRSIRVSLTKTACGADKKKKKKRIQYRPASKKRVSKKIRLKLLKN